MLCFKWIFVNLPRVSPCTDDREEVADHVCPLRLQMAWSAPDHVFRLCRRPTEVKEGEHKDALDGWLVKRFRIRDSENYNKLYLSELLL